MRSPNASDLTNPFCTTVRRGFLFFTPKFTPKTSHSLDLKGRRFDLTSNPHKKIAQKGVWVVSFGNSCALRHFCSAFVFRPMHELSFSVTLQHFQSLMLMFESALWANIDVTKCCENENRGIRSTSLSRTMLGFVRSGKIGRAHV